MLKPLIRPPTESESDLVRDYVIESLTGALNEQLAPQFARIVEKVHLFGSATIKIVYKEGYFQIEEEVK